jgi:formylglycine-generating enzyme required for sulfatase activity
MMNRFLGLALAILGAGAISYLVAAEPPASPTATKPSESPAKTLTLKLDNNVALRLVLIPAGTFIMGCPAAEKDPEGHAHPADEVQNEVTISKPFYMGVTEITQSQYEAVMGKHPSQFQGRDSPVDRAEWNDAVEFCRRASAKTGKMVRLPTEAEWEYACRAGGKGRYGFEDSETNLGEYAWYIANSFDRNRQKRTTQPVGRKKPNTWGLYDMHGNVWEWCSDWYAADYGRSSKAATDPTGPIKGSLHVLRGGSWNYCSYGCRASGRGRIGPNGRYDVNGGGFRVVVALGKD